MNKFHPDNNKANNYAFIDSQNLNLGVQKMGWKMDWRKFRQYLYDEYGVSQAYMFIGYMAEHEPMYEQLHELGYLIVLKPTVGMNDEKKSENLEQTEDQLVSDKATEERKLPVKGNIDADLVLHAMKELPNYNKAVIVSGDGDFYALVEYLAEQGKLLRLMTPNWQYSSLLKPFERYIVRLDKERDVLAYRDHKRRSKRKEVQS